MSGESLPTAFSPQLPRPQNSSEPSLPHISLGHIASLRESYIPPIHGGFQASDVGYDEPIHVERRSKKRERRFSASSVDTMDSLGLGLDIELDSTQPSAPRIDHAIREQDEYSDESESEDGDSEGEGERGSGHLDPFEREWAEKWSNGVVRRSQGWIEEHDDPEGEEEKATMKDMEAISRDSTAVLAMMAGTSAAGSLTRHLSFPVHHSLAAGLKALQKAIPLDPSLSPTTTSFLASLSTSPISPMVAYRPIPSFATNIPPSSAPRNRSATITSTSDLSASPATSHFPSSPRVSRRRRRRAAVPILSHDAPMQDHVSVGVQTWGSAILLGREMSLNPSAFGLFPGPSTPAHRGVRVLELGAGTGLSAILCRKLLDLRMASPDVPEPKQPGLIVATDFHHDVLANLKVCVDLNFPPHMPATDGASVSAVTATSADHGSGVKIAKLDWTTFPQYMEARQRAEEVNVEDNKEISGWVEESFDLVLASDCVYDPTHAKMSREVAGWVSRSPDENDPNDIGGTYHLLSPIRPTFTPESESIDATFPTLSSYPPSSERRAAAVGAQDGLPEELRGEGLGRSRGLRSGVRGEGKRSVKGRKGEGRVDEVAGYWWWEVGWG